MEFFLCVLICSYTAFTEFTLSLLEKYFETQRGIICILFLSFRVFRLSLNYHYLVPSFGINLHLIYLWFYSALLELRRFFSFLIPYTFVRSPWMGDHLVSRSLPTHRTIKTQNKITQTSTSLSGIRIHYPSVRASEGS
jgi:hypothetical protein